MNRVFARFAQFLLVIATPIVAHAAPGDVDATFGTGGYWSPPAECCGPSRGRAIAVQPDGKIVVAGYASNGAVDQTGVARFNADFTLDATFGTAGFARMAVGTQRNEARGVVLLADGRILVAGNYLDAAGAAHPFVMRLTSAGQLDTTFGSGGIRQVPVLAPGSMAASATGLALQADGKAVIVGSATLPGGRDLFAARFDANGDADGSFGSSGVVLSGAAGDDDGHGLAIDPDGRILVVGGTVVAGQEYPAARRLLSTGATDSSFNTGALALVGFAGRARAVIVQADGKYVLAGSINNGAASYRVDQAGALDPSYNGGGVRNVTGDQAIGLASMAGGDHAVLTSTGAGSQFPVFYVHRITPSGTPAPGWGEPSQPVGPHPDASLAAIAISNSGVPLVTSQSPIGILHLSVYAAINGVMAPGGYAAVGLVPQTEYRYFAVDSNGAILAMHDPWRQPSAAGAVVDRLTPAGQPDTTFGTGGRLELLTVGSRVPAGREAILVDSASGKFLHFDFRPDLSTTGTSGKTYLSLVRRNADGSLDGAFGSSTLQDLAFQVDNPPFERTFLVSYPGGKYLVSTHSALTRILDNGSVDLGFNLGSPIIATHGGFKWASAAVASDGAVLVTGVTGHGQNGRVLRLLANGAIDLSYGASGYAGVTLAPSTWPARIAIQADGKSVIAGWTMDISSGTSVFRTFVARLTSAGALDTSFGLGGVVYVAGIARGTIADVAIQPDGKILVAGTEEAFPTYKRAFVARYEAGGGLDSTFGNGGIAFPDLGPGAETARTLSLRPDGSMLIAGMVNANLSGASARAAVMKLHGAATAMSVQPPALYWAGVGVPYAYQLTGSGGTAPYTFAVTSGELPPGLALVGDTIQGSASRAGAHYFVIRATGADAQTASRLYSILVHDASTLVSSYYEGILGRAPDSGGQAFWEAEAARVMGLGASASDAFYVTSLAFFGSDEYQQRNRTESAYVGDLYRTFFGREPDAGGLAFWSAEIGSGKPRGALLNDFLFSGEFRAAMERIFGTSALSRAEVAMLMDFYRGLLGRLPDSTGFNHWLQQFRTAQCQGNVSAVADAMSAQFLGSPEYANREGARPAAERTREHVVDLYNAFLRRGGDLSGFQYWVQQVANGSQTREQVRQQFVGSPEFQARVAAVVAQGCIN